VIELTSCGGSWYQLELVVAGGVAGRLRFYSEGEEAYVDWVGVEETMRHRGVATELYQSLKGWCAGHGVRWLRGRVQSPYALQARLRVFGEPVELEPMDGWDEESPRWYSVTHRLEVGC
jgi:GNAT superfamily N-acetyltransferase